MLASTKTFSKVIALMAVVVFVLLGTLFPWLEVGQLMSGTMSVVATMVLVAELAFRAILWKPIAKFLKIPILTNVTEATLEFKHSTLPNLSRDFPAVERENAVRKTARVKIIQCFRHFEMILSTEQIRSTTFIGEIQGRGDDVKICYLYHTQPSSTYIANNPSQVGAGVLSWDASCQCYKGNYWTDQLTRGVVYLAPSTCLVEEHSKRRGGSVVDCLDEEVLVTGA